MTRKDLSKILDDAKPSREEGFEHVPIQHDELVDILVIVYNRGITDAARFLQMEPISLEGDEQDGYGMQLLLERLDALQIDHATQS